MMYVNNSSISVGNTSFSISSSELTAAQSLVDTYVVILKSRTTLEEIIDKNNLTYDYDELYEMIDSQSVNSTEIFNIDVTSADPQEAEVIANSITQILPNRIASIVDGSDVRIVDYAVVPSERTSPSYTINTIIGALVGLVFASAVVILRYLFDDVIHAEDYLTQTYPNIPLLAVVPDMLANDGGGYYYADEQPRSTSGGGKKRPAQGPAPATKPQRRPAQQSQAPAAQPQRRPAQQSQSPAAQPQRRPAQTAERTGASKKN